MSFLYELDPVEQNRALDNANSAKALDPNAIKADMFEGMAEAPITGLFAGAIAKPALLVGDAVTEAVMPLVERLDQDFNTGTAEWLKREQRKNVDMLKSLRDRQVNYGTASQIVNGFADVLPEAIGGMLMGGLPGAAAAVGAFQGYADNRLAIEDGVDPLTAAGKGAITGVTNALGVVIPMAKPGAALLTNLGIGAGSNVATGMVQRGATAGLLEARGYGEMAKQYQWLDREAILIDAILGTAFGGVGHYAHGRMAPRGADVDAALTANEKIHVEVDTAPGIPKTTEARDAHVEAQMRATEQMLRGETVDVADIARRVDAVEMETRAQFVEAQDAVYREVLPKEAFDTSPVADEAPRAVVEPQPRLPELERGLAQAESELAGAKAAGEQMAPKVVELQERVAKLTDDVKAEQQKMAKTHDGTESSLAKAGDIRPVENDLARQVVERRPDLMVRNDAGEMVSARDLMQQIDREIQNAQTDAALHDAAVACFLRG